MGSYSPDHPKLQMQGHCKWLVRYLHDPPSPCLGTPAGAACQLLICLACQAAHLIYFLNNTSC
jgi:hypothetical protein